MADVSVQEPYMQPLWELLRARVNRVRRFIDEICDVNPDKEYSDQK